MIEGSCLCKGMQFRIVGRHSEISMCHCSLCRKTTGGGPASEILLTAMGSYGSPDRNSSPMVRSTHSVASAAATLPT
jgi:hypothetical protein